MTPPGDPTQPREASAEEKERRGLGDRLDSKPIRRPQNYPREATREELELHTRQDRGRSVKMVHGEEEYLSRILASAKGRLVDQRHKLEARGAGAGRDEEPASVESHWGAGHVGHRPHDIKRTPQRDDNGGPYDYAKGIRDTREGGCRGEAKKHRNHTRQKTPHRRLLSRAGTE